MDESELDLVIPPLDIHYRLAVFSLKYKGMGLMRKRIYKVIEASDGQDLPSTIYDISVIVVILLSLSPLAFKGEHYLINIIDKVTASLFIIDYLLRFVTADYKFGKHSVISFIKYPFRPMAIIDLISILPSFTVIHAGFAVLRVFRLLRVVRVFKAMRYSKSLVILGKVLKSSRGSLMVIGNLALFYIIILALIIFNIEPDDFNNFFDAIYWATVSLLTGGYVGNYPVTTPGRIIVMFSTIFTVAIVGLTGGVITAGYVEQYKKHNHKDREEDMEE